MKQKIILFGLLGFAILQSSCLLFMKSLSGIIIPLTFVIGSGEMNRNAPQAAPPVVEEVPTSTRCTMVSADKMNVFYIGVDNPISISSSDAEANELQVSMMGGTIRAGRAGHYNVHVQKPGQVEIMVKKEGTLLNKFIFRAKRIPNPVARLSRSSSGAIGNGEFVAQGGVFAVLENFDFDAKCKIQGFID